MGCLKLPYQPQLKVHEQNSFLIERGLGKKDHEVKKCLSSYTFGFNGYEREDEVKGKGNSWNYKYRMHDARLGRFFAVDPLASSYPWNSPYAFSENRVIDKVELEGLEMANPAYLAQKQHPYLYKGARLLNGSAMAIGGTMNFIENSVQTFTKGGPGKTFDYWNDLLDDASMVMANDMIHSKVSGEHKTGRAYVWDRYTEPEALGGMVTTSVMFGMAFRTIRPVNYGPRTFNPGSKTHSYFRSKMGPLRDPHVTVGPGEGELINYTQGLASRRFGRFSNFKVGEIGDKLTKYLWTIDERGINVALEKTPANTGRGTITHTNISSKGYAGGEVWFTSKTSVYLNPKSVRFGGASMTATQYQTAIEYWQNLGYTVEAMEFTPPK